MIVHGKISNQTQLYPVSMCINNWILLTSSFCSIPSLHLKHLSFSIRPIFCQIAVTAYCRTNGKLSLQLLCCDLANGLWIHPEVYISIYKSILSLWNNIILEMCVCNVGVYYRVCGQSFYQAGFSKDLLL